MLFSLNELVSTEVERPVHTLKDVGSNHAHAELLFLIEGIISEFKSQKMKNTVKKMKNAVKKFQTQNNELTINRQKCPECLRKEGNSIESNV